MWTCREGESAAADKPCQSEEQRAPRTHPQNGQTPSPRDHLTITTRTAKDELISPEITRCAHMGAHLTDCSQ